MHKSKPGKKWARSLHHGKASCGWRSCFQIGFWRIYLVDPFPHCTVAMKSGENRFWMNPSTESWNACIISRKRVHGHLAPAWLGGRLFRFSHHGPTTSAIQWKIRICNTWTHGIEIPKSNKKVKYIHDIHYVHCIHTLHTCIHAFHALHAYMHTSHTCTHAYIHTIHAYMHYMHWLHAHTYTYIHALHYTTPHYITSHHTTLHTPHALHTLHTLHALH